MGVDELWLFLDSLPTAALLRAKGADRARRWTANAENEEPHEEQQQHEQQKHGEGSNQRSLEDRRRVVDTALAAFVRNGVVDLESLNGLSAVAFEAFGFAPGACVLLQNHCASLLSALRCLAFMSPERRMRCSRNFLAANSSGDHSCPCESSSYVRWFEVSNVDGLESKYAALSGVLDVNVAQFMGLTTDGADDTLFEVYRIGERGSIQENLAAIKGLHFADKCRLLASIVSGVSYLQAAGFSCSDLSSTTTTLSQLWSCKVLTSPASTRSHISFDGDVAPEHLSSLQSPYSAAIWRLGSIIWTVLHGELNHGAQRESLLDLSSRLSLDFVESFDASWLMSDSVNISPENLLLDIACMCRFGNPRLRPSLAQIRTVLNRLSVGVSLADKVALRSRLLAKVSLFDSASEDCRAELSEMLTEMSFTAGTTVIKYGDLGTNMFFVVEGIVVVYAGDGHRILSVLGPGAFFGEMALLFTSGRMASVTAQTDCVLLELKRVDFESTLTRNPQFHEIVRARAAKRVLKQSKLFTGVGGGFLSSLSARVTPRSVPAGRAIVSQGDDAHELFVIASGSCDVVRDGIVVNTLSEGAQFGELALVYKQQRAASVIAKVDTELLVISKADFDSSLAQYPQFRQHIVGRADEMRLAVLQHDSRDDDKSALGRLVRSNAYRITGVTPGEQVGSGKFGAVFAGDWNGTPVALKALISSDTQLEFLQEFQTLTALKHPNIVQFLGYSICPGETAGGPERFFLAFEWMAGGPVLDWVRAGSRSRGEMLRCMVDSTRAMAYLASQNFVHADLACRNLLLDDSNRCKVSDFGLSKLMDGRGSEDLEEGVIPVRWSSPERFDRGKPTSQSDVFSWAIAMFEMWSGGKIPYANLTNMQALDAILAGVDSICTQLPLDGNVPGDIALLLRKCWEPDPKHRPSFAQLLELVRQDLLSPSLSGFTTPALQRSGSDQMDTRKESPSPKTPTTPWTPDDFGDYATAESVYDRVQRKTGTATPHSPSPQRSLVQREADAIKPVETELLRGHMEVVRKFIPKSVLGLIAASALGPINDPLAQPYLSGHAAFREFSDAVVLVVDISGFSTLAESMTQRLGEGGAERVADLINQMFSAFQETISNYHGDTLKIAGDAVIVGFNFAAVSPTGRTIEQFAKRQRHVLVAFQCALEILSNVRARMADSPVDDDLRLLDVHASIACGQVICATVGGAKHAMEFFPTGAAFSQLAVDVAGRGEVVVSAECLEALGDFRTIAVVEPVEAHFRLIRLTETIQAQDDDQLDLPLIPSVCGLMEEYFPQALRRALYSGSLASDSLRSEMRQVSTVFVKLQLHQLTSSKDFELVSKLVRAVQQSVFSMDGLLRQFLVDDKGATVIIAVFGAPAAHSDDANRAVNFAFSALSSVKKVFSEGFCDAFAGVTTGRAFCGTVGSSSRHEYAVVGPSVNLSARLMGAISAGRVVIPDGCSPNVAIDDDTFKLVRGLRLVGSPNLISVKGKAEPVKVFLGQLSGALADGSSSLENQQLVRGRVPELLQLSTLAEKFHSSTCTTLQSGGDLLSPFGLSITGPAGLGKTCLAIAFSKLVFDQFAFCESESCCCAVLNNFSSSSQGKIIIGWRTLILDMLSDGSSDLVSDSKLLAVGRQAGIAAGPLGHVSTWLGLRELAKGKQSLSGPEVRLILDSLIKLIHFSCERKPHVFILDATRHMDKAGWQLVARLSTELRTNRCLIVITARPFLEIEVQRRDSVPAIISRTSSLPRVARISSHMALGRATLSARAQDYCATFASRISTTSVRLAPLNSAATGELVSDILGHAVNDEVTRFVYGRSGGNPLFAQVVAARLCSDRMLDASTGSFFKARAPSDLSSLPVPEEARVMLTPVLDLLNDVDRQMLKVASVIGFIFSESVLHRALKRISSLDASSSNVGSRDFERHLDKMQEQGLLLRLEEGEATAFAPLAIGVVAKHNHHHAHDLGHSHHHQHSHRHGLHHGHGNWRFHSTLLRDVVYTALPLGRQQALHKVLADVAESSGEAYLPLFAYHARLSQAFSFASIHSVRQKLSPTAWESVAKAWSAAGLSPLDPIPVDAQNAPPALT